MNNKHKIVVYPIKKYTIFGIIFGIIFPITVWLVNFISENYMVNFSDFVRMHQEQKLLYIIEIIPLIIGLGVFFLLKAMNKKWKLIQDDIYEKEEIIEKNSEIAKRIGEGDLLVSKKDIQPDDKLGNSLLKMRNNLVETYKKETEQNWIAKGKEIIADILRKHDNIEKLAYETLVSLINYTDSIQGAFYIFNEKTNKLSNVTTYAYNRKKYEYNEFNIGQGLVGQVAYEMAYIYRREIPNDYITISSGILGDKKPRTMLVSPLIGGDEKLQGVIEIASLKENMPRQMITLFRELTEIIGQTLFNLKVNTTTKTLLEESQELTKRLQKNEDAMKKNANQMKRTQIELEESNKELAKKMNEVARGQNRLFALLENASEVVTIYDKNGFAKYVSPSVKRILGFDAKEMIGKNRFDRGESILQEAFDKLIENPNITKTFEYSYENKNKELLWLETIGKNMMKNSAINGIIFNTRDITVRKIAERAQRLSGEMQALSENSPDMIIRVGPEGKFYYANPMVEDFLGLTPDKIVNNNIANIKINEDISRFLIEILDEVIKSGEKIDKIIYRQIAKMFKLDIETIFKQGIEKKIVQFNAIPEFNKTEELETILLVAHDVTDRKRIELEIKQKNKSITESINYAKRIQTAIIPSNDVIKMYLPKSFILHIPRDVVSGDFPWFFVKGDNVYIAAVDCTGHGVPGALLSFISQVRKTLKQDSPDANARDGMDIALCKINPKKRELEFAGAHRPLYHIRNGNLKQYKGNLKAVGGIPLRRRKKEADFVTHKINIENKDKIFFFSDGLPDQIGGESGRKYQAKRLRELVLKNGHYTMDRFDKFFYNEYISWKGKYKQIDDILLIGVEF